MIVMKFGGVPVSTGANIRNIAKLVEEERKKEDVVVVVSAIAKVTDKLIEISDKISNAPVVVVETEVEEFYKEIFQMHKKIAEDCIDDQEILKETIENIKSLLDKLRVTLIGVGYLEELNPRFLDFILTFGERMSILIVSGAIRNRGIKSKSLTGYEAGIITDSNFGCARPLPSIDKTIKESLMPLINDGVVPVVSGFIAADVKGRMTTLGRGGSDYTASLIGRYLDAREVQILKDVDGILSADPKIVPGAKLINSLSYVEAMDLACFGAKVIYSRMIEPAMEANIPVRVKSVYNPDKKGSLIVKAENMAKGIIKAVTMMKDISVINLKGVGMAETPGLAGRIFTALGDENINVVMISGSSEANISFVVKSSEKKRAIEKLEEFKDTGIRGIEMMDNVRVIAVVGSGMRGSKGIAAKIFTTIAENDANIIMIAQGSSEVNISFVIEDKNADEVLKSLHRKFIEEVEE